MVLTRKNRASGEEGGVVGVGGGVGVRFVGWVGLSVGWVVGLLCEKFDDSVV